MLNLNLPLSQIIAHIKPHSKHFDDWRIDYTNWSIYLYVHCVISYQDTTLLLKRSSDVRCPWQWSGCSWFYDEAIDPLQHMWQEILEEIWYDYQKLILLRTHRLIEYDSQHHQVGVGETYYFQASEQFTPELNWEHDEYCRIPINKLDQYDTTPWYHDAIIHYTS
jgi:hypothetical protein